MRKLLLFGTILLSISVILTGCQAEQQPDLEEIRMEEERQRIAYAYLWLHRAVGFPMGFYLPDIGFITLPEEQREWLSTHSPFYKVADSDPNEYGIHAWVYMLLLMFYHRTGTNLSYEQLVAYFDEEFEPDGSLRLYNNGLHPQIEAFVEWTRRTEPWLRNSEFSEYWSALSRIYRSYLREVQGMEFEESRLIHLFNQSPQVLDAVTRAYADPDYVLDLTSLLEFE